MELAQGLYLAFEAVDGVGKSTHIQLLKEWLEREHYTVFTTREPGGTDCPIAEQIRNIILNKENTTMLPMTEAMLFAASRTQSVNEIIVPHLENKEIVISDRSIGSSLAYQGYGRQLNPRTISSLNRHGIQDRLPDYTFYLQVPYQEAMKRRAERGYDIDRMEAADKQFFMRAIEGFDNIAKSTESWLTIDATGDVEHTQDAIRILVRSILAQKRWRAKDSRERPKTAPARTYKDYVRGTQDHIYE